MQNLRNCWENCKLQFSFNYTKYYTFAVFACNPLIYMGFWGARLSVNQGFIRLSNLLFRRLISLSKCCLKANASGESFLLAGWTICQAEGRGKPSTSTIWTPCSLICPWSAWLETKPSPSPPATDSFNASLLPNSRRMSGLNFFLLKNQAKILPEEFSSGQYFYPEKLLKEMKNLVLSIERGDSKSEHVQHEARGLLRRQLEAIKLNQERLQNLHK